MPVPASERRVISTPAAAPPDKIPPKVLDTYYVGIDPGVSGGIAVLSRADGVVVTYPMPESVFSLWSILSREVFTEQPVREHYRVCVEKVTGYVGNAGDPGARMFVFGVNYGAIQMALVALDLFGRFDNPVAQVWQKRVGAPKREEGSKPEAYKRLLKAHAQALYPDVDPTLSTADAVLLAHYSMLEHGGAPAPYPGGRK